jgi:NAD(P)H-binding
MSTAVIGATGRVGSEIVRGLLARGDVVTALVRDPARPAAPSANPAGWTSVPPAWTTRPTLPRHWTGSARYSSRWDRSGPRASCGGSRSAPPPPGSPRSSRSPAFGAQCLGGLTTHQPASPRQHRPVRRLDRRAVLHDPPRDLLRVAARRGARGARLAHLDRSGRHWPDGPDRPPRRGRGRAARAHRPGAMGRAPRPDRTGSPVLAGGARAAVGRTRRARHLHGRGRAGVPRAPDRRRGTRGDG